MSKLRKANNKKLILILPIILVVSFGVLTYSFANFKSIKLFDAVGGFFLGNEYTLSYDVANCTNKTIKNGKTYGELCVPATPDGYTFDGWYYNGDLIESTTQVHTNQNIQLLAHFTQTFTCNVGDVYNFDYTGDEQAFTTKCSGQYKLEVWGAQGGNTVFNSYSDIGGYGAYSTGEVLLNQNDRLYVNVGGKGIDVTQNNNIGSFSSSTPGYNGGTYASYPPGNSSHAGGGGATHIATKMGELSSLNSNRDKIIIVAGGGGGASSHVNDGIKYSGPGGNGGGFIGNNSNNAASCTNCYALALGGSQSSGGEYIHVSGTIDYPAQTYYGSFGKGGTTYSSNTVNDRAFVSGGGGGYFGGGGGIHYSGAGGSGYIGNSILSNKHMTCYNCQTSFNYDTKTISNTCVAADPTVDCSKKGNGYARITYLGVPVTVTFNALDGNVSESTRSVIKNNQIGTLPIPTNGDYAFNGWYLDREYTNEVSSSYVVTENITLYAKWDLNKLYLYRNGNISTLVGSFKRIEGHGYSYEMNPSVTYADSYIRINSGAGNTNNYAVALVSNNLINTTGYNKLCVTASHNGSGCNFNNGNYAYGISTGNSSISSGYVDHLNGMVVTSGSAQCINISSYNSSYYLVIGNSYSGYSDFSEVWLEK